MSGDLFEEEHAPHENHERYLLTYADMITLLMALFIILFAIGQTDVAKFKRFQVGLQKSFGAPALDGGTGLLDGGQLPIDPRQTVALNYANPGLVDPHELDGTMGTGTDIKPVEIDQANAEATVATLRQVLEQAGITDTQVHVDVDERGVVIALATDDVTFESGSFALDGRATASLEIVARVLQRVTNGIVVEGHTDSIPMTGSYTNWELSAFRAGAVVRYFEQRHGIDSTRFTLAGYAETRPIADNATAQGRAKNRRIEVVITTPPGRIQTTVVAADAAPASRPLDPIGDPVVLPTVDVHSTAAESIPTTTAKASSGH
ncbi:MAG: OmpA family protein [Acidimicrobiales bacterium]